MSRRLSIGLVLVVVVVVSMELGGCSGGTQGRGKSSVGAPSRDGGAADDEDGGGAGNGTGTGQDLPPYKGRIVVTPAALLFTKAGQSASLHAEAFDADGNPMSNASFTFSSSHPDEVSVDASGRVKAITSVGSTQITVSSGDSSSPPLLVLVAQPSDGTLLVSDAQIVSEPTPVDPSAAPEPGMQVMATLDGVPDLAPGTLVLAREGKALAGRVVSTQPNGKHTDVVLELVPLVDMFSQLKLDAGWDLDLQTLADQLAIAQMATAPPPGVGVSKNPLDFDLGPLKCTAAIGVTGVTIQTTFRVTPQLHFHAAFEKDENGDWTTAVLELTGSIKTTGTASVKVAPGVTASLSCKLKLGEFIIPIGGPLAVVIGPRIPVGVKLGVKAAAMIAQVEFGGKAEESADFDLGISGGTNGTGDIASVSLGDPHFEPIAPPNNDSLLGAELTLDVGAYAGLSVTFLKLSLAEAFGGARAKYQLKPLAIQLGDSSFANKYEVNAPVITIGPGKDLRRALSWVGGAVNFNVMYSNDGLPIGRSPFGKFTADKMEMAVGDTLHTNITLDPSATKFLGISNVSGIHIYRIDAGSSNPNEVSYMAGPGPSYDWSWTPGPLDVGQYIFAAAVDDRLDLIPFEVSENATAPVHVRPKQTGWSGTVNLKWSGSGPTSSGGNFTESGTETITYEPDTSQPADGMNFGLKATSVKLSLTYDDTDPVTTTPTGCSRQITYHAIGTIDRAGTVQDTTLLQIAPNGDYAFPIQGLAVDADFMQTVTDSGCTDATSMTTTGTAPYGSDGNLASGNVPPAATSFADSLSYSSPDGTLNYIADWTFMRN